MPSGTPRPSHSTCTIPFGNVRSAITARPDGVRTTIRKWSACRIEKSMCAALVAQLQTGEKVLSTCVCEIGLGSSFRCCVTTKAVAVASSKISTSTVGAVLFTPSRFYEEPNGERGETETDADCDHVARRGHVQQLDPAQREHAGETEPESVLGKVERVPAREPDARDRAEQEPPHRVEVDVALHEVADARDPEQGSRVEDVGADDPRDRQRVDHHHHEPEERPAADGRQPDDVAENGAEDHCAHLVLSLHHEAGLAGLHAALDERLQ